MGYYSTIYIQAKDSDVKNKILKVMKKHNLKPEVKKNLNKEYLLELHGLKWYPVFKDVSEINETIFKLCDEDKAAFVRIGESDFEEYYSDYGDIYVDVKGNEGFLPRKQMKEQKRYIGCAKSDYSTRSWGFVFPDNCISVKKESLEKLYKNNLITKHCYDTLKKFFKERPRTETAVLNLGEEK